MEEKQSKNWLEWVVLSLSSLLVLGIIGLLVHQAVTMPDTPPAIAVALGQAEEREGYVVVPLAVSNGGFQTAKDVRIEITTGRGRQEEKATIEFPYLPGQSTARGWATFTQDPGDISALQIRIVGYSTP